jgi:6-phosphogluconolactonase (cycloisomerase 2 family)
MRDSNERRPNPTHRLARNPPVAASLSRRPARAATIIALLVLLGVAGLPVSAIRSGAGSSVLYAAVGPVITRYAIDAERATLQPFESVSVAGNVQYAWQHPNRRHLYVVWSAGSNDTHHGVTTFDIEPGSGVLQRHGADVPLKYRPIHVTIDRSAAHLLIAYNRPAAVTVHRLAADGTIGAEIPQAASLDLGIYPHQVRVEPTTGTVLVVGRGNYPEGGKATTDPGSMHALDFHDEQLSNRPEVALGGGAPFNPRHLDFHPSTKWILLSVELQNRLEVYRRTVAGAFDPSPLFTKDSLTHADHVRPEFRQLAGAIHVHPNGRFVYQANRGTGTAVVDGKRVWAGGFNNIAVFRLDTRTGEPTLIQNADTHGLMPRTFALDADARMLVAANMSELPVRAGAGLTVVPASLAIFRVRDDGTLAYVGKVDVDTNDGRRTMFWMHIVPLPR